MSVLLLRKQSDKKKTFKWLVYDNTDGYNNREEAEAIYGILHKKFTTVPDNISGCKLKWNIVGYSHDKISKLIELFREITLEEDFYNDGEFYLINENNKIVRNHNCLS